MAKYIFALDWQDGEVYASTFTEDGVLDSAGGVVQGRKAIREMIEHPASIVGVSDGGADCGLICDASFPTYLLTHWTRDRTRGPRIPLELVVHKQTQATARAYGLPDRGALVPGLLADVNVIDLDALQLHRPPMVHDLPAAGRRLLQDVDGYRTTIKAGETTFVDGEGFFPKGHHRKYHLILKNLTKWR